MRLWIMALSLMLIAPSSLATTPWQQVKQPVNGAPQSIGGFSNGCIVGAVALPLNSAHYQVMRSGQLRYFGHPDLIAFIHSVTKKAAQRRLGTVLIGDMSMPAGGRFSSGHASHQTGLDVDIWLQLPDERWSQKRLQNPKAIDLVDRSGKRVVDSLWQPQIGKLIKLAAQEQEVTRIFVHPAIKQRLCLEAGRDRAWLRKVRPWFGHRAHMHIRIACPKGSSDCIEQPLPPSGDGCGEELTSWLRDTSSLPTGKSASRPVPELPLQCQSLLENNFKLAQ